MMLICTREEYRAMIERVRRDNERLRTQLAKLAKLAADVGLEPTSEASKAS